MRCLAHRDTEAVGTLPRLQQGRVFAECVVDLRTFDLDAGAAAR